MKKIQIIKPYTEIIKNLNLTNMADPDALFDKWLYTSY